ncbi:hypothetical protein [Streptomyces syringium]|uniref:hypothetical protein n=1 Tax=Streptomyces syringium TaxID=76729 RepID=UPI0037D790D0
MGESCPLSRFTADTWRRLAPMADPAPKQSSPPGRCCPRPSAGRDARGEGRTTDTATWLHTPQNFVRLAALMKAAEARGARSPLDNSRSS